MFLSPLFTMTSLRSYPRVMLFLLVALALIAVPQKAQAQERAVPTAAPTVTDTKSPEKIAEEVKAAHRAKLKAFYTRYPVLKDVVSTRVGNSSGGTTEEIPADKSRDWPRAFPDGAPMRLAIPHRIDKAGLLWEDGKRTGEPLIVLHSTWNEGGWHTTYVTTAGKVIGGTFDRPWSVDIEIPSGPVGALGYSWKSDDGGFVMTTPKATLYSLVTIGSAVVDPANPNLLFTMMNAHVMDWSFKGSGKEHRSWSPSFDYEKYPTDTRKGG
ncbi:MAG: hypothetical protein V4671_18180, partial [Armatimonadota bacterium]